MTTRSFRRVAGLLSLVAMSASMTERLWAATCAPMEEDGAAMAAHAPATAMNSPAEMGMGYGRHDQAHADAEDRAPCPFAASASFGGCVSVATIAPLPPTIPIPPKPTQLVTATVASHDLLLEASLFRPPRA
ncbi:MAG: hypothetical protein WEG36_01215 [Gemmatimonadota bacterium]